jgi:L-iditol 2-dehydrogenase
VDVAVICIGVPALVNDALRLTRKGGNVNIFAGLAKEGMGGDRGEPRPLQRADPHRDLQLHPRGLRSGAQAHRVGRVATETMVTHRFPLAQAVEAIDKSASGEGIKVAVMP